MRTIWKFPIPIIDEIEVLMPAGAEVLSVGNQQEAAQVWAAVDDEMPTNHRHFKLRGTGHPLTGDEGRFVGSFQLAGGRLVFHLFEAA